jgi:hypothetical protein
MRSDDDEAVEIHRRADHVCAAPGGSWNTTGRCVPTTWLQRGELLHLEEALREPGNDGVKELRQLRDENTRLKRLVADLTLDKHILAEVVRKKL